MRFPFVLFCIFTFILVGRPQDYFTFIGVVRPASTLTLLLIVITALRPREPGPSPFELRETKTYLALFAVLLIGVPFSLWPKASLDYIMNIYVQNVVFYVMCLYYLTTVNRFKQFVVLLVLTNAFFTVISLRYGDFGGGRYSTISSMYDPNDLAAVAISMLAFPVAVLLGSFKPLVKWLAGFTVVFGVLLALYTGSRGGLIGLTTFLVLFLILRIPSVSGSRKIIILSVLVVGALININKINVDRYRTMFSLEEDYNTTEDQGRVAVWKRGLAIFADHPVTGVGVSRFLEAIGTMRRGDGNVPPRWQAAHNSYIQILAETGIFGGALFVLMMIQCLKILNRLTRAPKGTPFASPEMEPLRVMAPILFSGLVAYAVTAFFLSYGYSVQFPLWFGVAASLVRIAALAQPSVAASKETSSATVSPALAR